MASDGALIVDTSIDNSGFKRGANEFKRAVDGLKNTVDKTGKGMAETANGYVRAMNSAKDAAKGAAADQAAIAKEIERTETALKRLEEKLDTQRRKFEAARDAAEQKAAAEFSERTANYELLPWEDEAQAAEALLNDMAAEIKKVSDSFGEFEDTAAFRNLNVEIEATREKLDTLKASYQDSAPAEGLRGAFDAVKESVSNALASLAKMAGSGALSFLKKLASGAKNAAIQLAKLAGRAVQTGLQMVAKYAATAAKSMLGLRNSASSASSGFKMGLGNILKYGVGISSVSALFKKLRTAITESFNELASRNPEVNAAVTSMQSALSSLKASFASAFAPIYTAVAPAITYLINLLSSAISTLASFFAALTGSSTVSKAISSIGSSASKSAGSVDKLKRALAGFDTLNVLNDNSSSSGGGSGGGGGSGTMYTTEQIESSIQEFVAKLKDLWTDGQYEEIGKLLAEGINKAFEHAKTLISWENVSGTVESTIDAITGVFNGLIDGVEWTQIGETFGAGADTIIRTVNRLFAKIKFANIGTALANMLNGLVSKINPQQLGKFLTNKVNAAFNILRGFVLKFKWGAAGVKFGQTANALFKEIDWDAITTAINEGAKGALEFGTEFLNSFDESAAATNLKNAINKIDWDGIAKQAWDLFKLAVSKLGNFLTVLFSTDEQTPVVKPQIDKHAVEKAMTEADKAAGGSGIKVDVSPEGIGTALSTALHNILTAIGNFLENLPWEQWGKDLGAFLASIDWIQLGKDLAKALSELLNGLDDLVSAAVYGENYKENKLWQTTHPSKYGKYVEEEKVPALMEEYPEQTQAIIDLGQDLQEYTETLDEIKKDEYEGTGDPLADFLLKRAGMYGEYDIDENKQPVKREQNEPETEIQSELLKTEDLRLDAAKKETKTTNALTKALKNKAAVAELTIDLEGNEDLGDLASGKATTTVNVGFTPEGQKEEDEPKGLLDWLQAIFDPGVSATVTLEKNGVWKSFLDFLGIDTNSPIIRTLINLVKNNFETFLKFLGFDTSNPIIQALVNLVKGTFDGSASNIISLAGTALAAIAGYVNLNQGNRWYTSGWSVISLAGKTLATIIGYVNLNQGNKWYTNGWSAIMYAGKTLANTICSVILKRGPTWLSDAWSVVSTAGSTFTTTVGAVLKEGKTFAETAWTAITSKSKEITETVNVKNGKLSTTAKNAVNAGKTNTKTETIDLKNGKMDGTAKNAVNAGSSITKTIKVGLEIDPNKKEVKLSGGISKGSWYLESRAIGGIINAYGKVRNFASGGAIMRNGRSSWWNSVNKYAAGTSRAHGTVFVAGENGPEIMGHVNGRTEILNKSQLADALYGAVVSGMAQAVNALGAYIVNHMTVCTNAIVSTIAANSLPTYGLSSYYAPAMASGAVMPYEVAAQIARSTADIQNTLDTNNEELIQAMVSAISNAAASIVMAMNLHGNNNSAPLTARALSNTVIDEINRMTRMNGQSPILGV